MNYASMNSAAVWFRRNVELGALFFLMAIVLAVWGFAELAEEVVE